MYVSSKIKLLWTNIFLSQYKYSSLLGKELSGTGMIATHTPIVLISNYGFNVELRYSV